VTIELLTSSARWLVAGGGIALLAGALALRRRPGARAVVMPLALVGQLALGVVLGERLLALVAHLATPDGTDYNEYRWIALTPWGRTGLIAGGAVAVAIVALSWRASARLGSPLRRAAVVGLRAGAVGAALVLFLEPAVELRQVAREPNRVAILVDDSASMALQDEPGGATRSERARAILAASSATFADWKRHHLLDFYRFGDSVRPSTAESAAAGPAAGRATLLRDALAQVRSRYQGSDLAGIIVLSDGTATGGLRDGAMGAGAADFLKSLDTHVHGVLAGAPGLKDVAVADVRADEFAFVRTAVKLEAVISSTGFPVRRIPVALRKDGQVLREKWVEVGPGPSTATVEFEFTPARVGKFVYEITTPVADGEAVRTNNSRAFLLRVIRDKIRVLQVAGRPSWDVRALRRMLKSNPNIDLISFFILRTHEDVQPVPQEEMSLIPFPTQELFASELPSFDLIVLQNFEFLPYGIGAYLENIRQYVQGGGGLIMLGGDSSFSSGLYANTPIAATLPVELLPNHLSAAELLDPAPFQPRLTEEGAAHPVTALRYAAADNAALWSALPKLDGTNLVGDARPGATVLAVHPTRKTASGAAMPIIAGSDYHDGRSLVITTDSLWRWGFVAAARPGDDGRHYLKLWENVIRWTIQDPELRYLHVQASAAEYYAGEPIKTRVRLLDRDYSPLAGGAVRVEVRRVEPAGPDGAPQPDKQPSLTAEVTVDQSGQESMDLDGLAKPGAYQITARANVGGRSLEAMDLFMVRAGSVELENPAPSPEILRQVAETTGGRYLGGGGALPPDLPFREPQIVRVDRRTDVELWSRPWILACALLLLGLEWGLRQRSGSL
jgi:uncharacterized membrane protein